MPPDNASSPVGVGVLGATGYAGQEVLRLLLDHPMAHVRGVSSRQFAGAALGVALPALPDTDLLFDDDDFDPQAWRARGISAVFACLPHGAFAARAEGFLRAGMRVIDLSSDFRLADNDAYARHYQWQHPKPMMLKDAVYGLTEWTDAALLRQAQLVANPGCYATAMLMAALPAVKAGWLAEGPVFVNAMSGVSGAGRGVKAATQFAECSNSVSPYRTGEAHQHLGEVGQTLRAAGADWFKGTGTLVFNPFLVPMGRGILANVLLPLNQSAHADAVRQLYLDAYRGKTFVRVLAEGQLPETRFVRGSNRVDVSLQLVANGTVLSVFSAIDNLLKGAAGQAVQNFNVMFGFEEGMGLAQGGLPCI